MSNFLGQLVARSLHQTPLVQPRLPSLFEPMPQANQPEWTESVERTEPHVSEPRAPAPFATTLLTVPSRAEQKAPSPVPPRSASPSANEINPPSCPTRPALTIRVASPPNGHRDPGGADAESPPMPPVQAPSSPATKPVSELVALTENHIVQKPASTGTLRPILRLPTPSPTAVPQLKPVPPIFREPLRAESPRAIQVTIGRVEIRAVTTSSPPARTARLAAAKLSLEDYLQQRNGGRT